MNRKKIALIAYLVIIISINIIIWPRIITEMLTPKVLTPYENMLATTPDSITCTTQIVDNVVVLNEYVELVPEDCLDMVYQKNTQIMMYIKWINLVILFILLT